MLGDRRCSRSVISAAGFGVGVLNADTGHVGTDRWPFRTTQSGFVHSSRRWVNVVDMSMIHSGVSFPTQGPRRGTAIAGPAADSVQSRFWPLQKKIGIFPDLNPDLAGIPDFGESGIPIWLESRIREIGNPDFAGIPDSGNRESRFCRDREFPSRCRGIGDLGVWRIVIAIIESGYARIFETAVTQRRRQGHWQSILLVECAMSPFQECAPARRQSHSNVTG